MSRAVMGRWKNLVSGASGESHLLAMLALTPVLLGVVILITAGSRNTQTAIIALDAARSAARAGSSAHTAGEAPAKAIEAFNANLDPNYRGSCQAAVDATTWDAGSFSVTVQCEADMGIFAGMSLGGASAQPRTVERIWTEPVDAARLVRTGP